MPNKNQTLNNKTEQKGSNINKKDSTETQNILERAMPLAEFRQLVQDNIPYNGYVFGVGNVKYIGMNPENPPVLIPDTSDSDSPIPYRRESEKPNGLYDPWFWGGVGAGGFSFYRSFVAFDMYNPWYWTSAKGVRISTQILEKNPITGKLFQGATGYGYGYASAANRAKPLLKFATKVNCIGLIIPFLHTGYVGEINTEDTTDFVFAAVAFIPGVGWVISGVYTVVDIVSIATTGEKISTHAKRGVEAYVAELAEKWNQVAYELSYWIHNMMIGNTDLLKWYNPPKHPE